jgi:hypothetical protein
MSRQGPFLNRQFDSSNGRSNNSNHNAKTKAVSDNYGLKQALKNQKSSRFELDSGEVSIL